MRNFIIPIFVPHIGCPNDCVFCNQRKITGISTDIDEDDVRDKIEEYLKTIPEDNRNLEIAFFGGSFTGIELDIQKKFLDIAFSYKKRGIVNMIRISTRPDYIDSERIDILKKRGVDTIELGIQSLSSDVLKKSNRGHDRESVFKAAEMIKENDFTLGVQMMLGLPDDTEKKAIKTAKELISLNPKIARIYPTLVIKETELENDYNNGEYKPLSLEESINLCKKIIYLFEKNGINIIRVGLQPSDNIAEGKDLVAGPFHPAYRQLVESEIYYDIIVYILSDLKKNILKASEIEIEIKSKLISYISGQKRRNILRLKDQFKIDKIKLRANDDLDQEIKVYLEKNRRQIISKVFDINIIKDRLYSYLLEDDS
ncbi:MAG: radical SAM protein [Andreesenia angusta]|nr:radical SAM protein [Andreesenia angusta]